MINSTSKGAAILLAIITATITLVTSCSDYDNGFDEATISYNKNFIDRFGQIDPNQDWNLVRQLAEKNGGGTRVNIPEKNLWADGINHNYRVPGFPDEYGIYHVLRGNKLEHLTIDELQDSDVPAGDVTEEEIQWVSQWYRTHYEPEEEENISWQDYFVQDISADYDRESTGYGSNPEKGSCKPNGNYASCDNGARIDKITLYKKYTFKYDPDPNKINMSGWEKADGSDTRTIKYGMEKLIIAIDSKKEKWNPDNTFTDDNDPNWARWEHIYNFNSGTGTNDYGTVDKVADESGKWLVPNDKLSDRTIQLYEGSGTADFSYHNSDANKRFRQYRLKNLVFDIPQDENKECYLHKRNCSSHHYDGYYLGFDYEVYITNAQPDGETQTFAPSSSTLVDEPSEYTSNGDDGNKLGYKARDGFYSNWIIKISKGLDVDGNSPSEYPKNKILEQGLLVCEDLGDTDYDFNDVVLRLRHVKHINNKDEEDAGTGEDWLRVTAMAAGGAMPSNIYVAPCDGGLTEIIKTTGNDGAEIHNLLDGRAPQIINAGARFGKEGMTWNYKIDFSKFSGITDTEKRAFASYAFAHKLVSVAVNNIPSDNNIVENGFETHTPTGNLPTGEVPQMMFLPIDYLWPQEQKPIDIAYTDFTGWVKNVSNTEWYNKPIEEKVTWRYVPIAQESVQNPKLTVTMVDGTTIKDGDFINGKNVGDEIQVICTSPNKEPIKCQIIDYWMEGTTFSNEYYDVTWENGLLTIKIKKKPTNQLKITFRQEDQKVTEGEKSASMFFIINVNG